MGEIQQPSPLPAPPTRDREIGGGQERWRGDGTQKLVTDARPHGMALLQSPPEKEPTEVACSPQEGGLFAPFSFWVSSVGALTSAKEGPGGRGRAENPTHTLARCV